MQTNKNHGDVFLEKNNMPIKDQSDECKKEREN